MREYPTLFGNNIESRDTNIFPVLVFGITENWNPSDWQAFPNENTFQDFLFLSTTNCNLTFPDNTTFDAAPIMLNLSNLKESLDLNKGNHKLSTLTATISNAPYGGKRFSDAINELESTHASLTGMTARIFWVSQTSQRILGTVDKFSCYQSFSGIVNKYSYSKDIATIVLEDDTSLMLEGKEFPINYLTADEVPEKYKNKPIPVVYGDVDKSPCVISSTPFSEEETSNADSILKVESQANVVINELYVFKEDSFLSAPREITKPLSDFNYPEGNQWEDQGNKIIFEKLTGSVGDNDAVTGGKSAVSNNNIILYKKGNITEILPNQNGEIITNQLWDGANSYVFRDNSNNLIVSGTVSKGDWSEQNTSESFAEENGFDADGTDNIPELDEVGHFIQVACSVGMDIPLSSKSSGVIQDQGYMYADYQIGMSALARTSTFNVLVRAGGNQNNDYENGFYTTSFYSSHGGTGENPYYHNANIISSDKIQRWDELGFYVTARSTEMSQYIGEMGVLIKFNDVYIDYYAEAEKLHTLSFYADVGGRLSDDPTPPKIINNLLIYELTEDNEELSGLSVNTTPQFDDTEYSGWKYATTINDKKEGKKFIQELLSVSPYLMRYNHIGDGIEFKGINSTYNINDVNNARNTSLIKIEDIIDFSFSKTKIEDVYHEVSFNYKWDYGKGEFSKNYTFNYEDAMQLDSYDIKFHGESMSKKTLTIDDERGKYIRDDETAKAFAEWKFYQNCNQHLKIKVQLPLKYMKYEPGDIVAFDEIIKDIKPYGINYKHDAEFDGYLGDKVNGQQVYPLFIINSMSKGLIAVDMECTQLHNLRNSYYSSIDENSGCMNPVAWNYDENATFEPTGMCVYPGDYLVPAFDWGCPVFELGESGEGDEDILDVSTNFAGDGTYADEFNDDDNIDKTIFIANTPEQYEELVSKPNGAAYIAWVVAGQDSPASPNTWNEEGALKIYLVSNCEWQDKIPHNINRVTMLLNNQDGIHQIILFEWNLYLGTFQSTLDTSDIIDSNYVEDIIYNNTPYDDLNDSAKINVSLKFEFLIPEGVDDFSFANNNSLEFQIKGFDWGLGQSIEGFQDIMTTENSYNIINFSKDDDISNDGNSQTYTIEKDFKMYKSTQMPSGDGSGSIWGFDKLMNPDNYLTIMYDLNINTDPEPTTELFRDESFIFSTNQHVHAPLFGSVSSQQARDNNKKSTIADVLEVANSEKIDSELLLETIKKVTGE